MYPGSFSHPPVLTTGDGRGAMLVPFLPGLWTPALHFCTIFLLCWPLPISPELSPLSFQKSLLHPHIPLQQALSLLSFSSQLINVLPFIPSHSLLSLRRSGIHPPPHYNSHRSRHGLCYTTMLLFLHSGPCTLRSPPLVSYSIRNLGVTPSFESLFSHLHDPSPVSCFSSASLIAHLPSLLPSPLPPV